MMSLKNDKKIEEAPRGLCKILLKNTLWPKPAELLHREKLPLAKFLALYTALQYLIAGSAEVMGYLS